MVGHGFCVIGSRSCCEVWVYENCLRAEKYKARRTRTLSSTRIASGGSFCSGFVGNGSMNVKGPDLGLGLKEVLHGIVDLLILFMLISLSTLLFIRKAQVQTAIGVGVRD